ncbi:helix-turn-helix domain-containing protein [Agrobacterium sp. ES01]|uniref:helix-turn-helix domain-containing protein n=1 Tax=Agrobacterium sp. ES01 TaxID=3420714 RepID=UPI003D11D944
MAAPQTKIDNMDRWYLDGLAGFINAIELADKNNQLDDLKNFAEVLNWSFSKFGLAASELAEDEKISKAAISKWVNGHALPSAPTRKTVINWIKGKLQEQRDGLTATPSRMSQMN